MFHVKHGPYCLVQDVSRETLPALPAAVMAATFFLKHLMKIPWLGCDFWFVL
jgi:hypothetical protein